MDRSSNRAELSAGTLIALLVFKGLAWSVSLASFRGGPTFPAIFVGLVGGVLVANLLDFGRPRWSRSAWGDAVAMLRLPLSSVILAMVVTQAGLSLAPLIIVSRGRGLHRDRGPSGRDVTVLRTPRRPQLPPHS